MKTYIFVSLGILGTAIAFAADVGETKKKENRKPASAEFFCEDYTLGGKYTGGDLLTSEIAGRCNTKLPFSFTWVDNKRGREVTYCCTSR